MGRKEKKDAANLECAWSSSRGPAPSLRTGKCVAPAARSDYCRTEAHPRVRTFKPPNGCALRATGSGESAALEVVPFQRDAFAWSTRMRFLRCFAAGALEAVSRRAIAVRAQYRSCGRTAIETRPCFGHGGAYSRSAQRAVGRDGHREIRAGAGTPPPATCHLRHSLLCCPATPAIRPACGTTEQRSVKKRRQ